MYPFGITVRSQSSSGESATVTGQLEIMKAYDFKAKIRPFRTTSMRKGNYFLSLSNTSVSDADISLDGCDLDEGCKFQFKPARILLAAWNTIELPLVIRPKRNSILGQEKRFDVTITASAEGVPPQTAACEFNHSPLMKSWKPIWRMVKIVITLVIIGVAIYYILKMGGGWSAFRESPKSWFDELIKTVQGWFS